MPPELQLPASRVVAVVGLRMCLEMLAWLQQHKARLVLQAAVPQGTAALAVPLQLGDLPVRCAGGGCHTSSSHSSSSSLLTAVRKQSN